MAPMLPTASHSPRVLDPNGNEIRRFAGPVGGTPWANPANIAFDDLRDRILFTNHASLVKYDPALFAVIDVAINDKGASLP
jgi:hypothetical protein